MVRQLLIRGVTLLEAPGRPPRQADVLLQEGVLVAIDPDAAAVAEAACTPVDAGGCWLGPALVDPHSVLEEPLEGRAETLASLGEAAASGGYGTVALLPWAPTWRDRPERLRWSWSAPLQLLPWGSFSVDGLDRELAPHADQLTAGACGLAAGATLPPIDLLERGLRLAEMGDRPVLLPPRDGSLAQRGFVRERVEALRAGWPLDPPGSETLPLETLLALADDLPALQLRLMNLSTAEAVARLRRQARRPMASVSWWHLVADSGGLDPADDGWLLEPALGDRPTGRPWSRPWPMASSTPLRSITWPLMPKRSCCPWINDAPEWRAMAWCCPCSGRSWWAARGGGRSSSGRRSAGGPPASWEGRSRRWLRARASGCCLILAMRGAGPTHRRCPWRPTGPAGTVSCRGG